mgnify:CR=1 FL=1|jgi:dUTP pyrophosphatase
MYINSIKMPGHLELLFENESYIKQIDTYVSKQDSGFDVYFPEAFTINAKETALISLNIKCRVLDDMGNALPYWLVPRSSIYKSGVRMANSVGIIDSNYRGELKVPLDNITDKPITIEAGIRLFQICSHDLLPFSTVKKVESLDNTERGSGGFGSTGVR